MVELWKNNEIATNLTAPGTVRTIVRRKMEQNIWENKHEETCKQVWQF